MKEKIIEIVGFNMEPERAELIAQQVLDLFAVSGSLPSENEINNKALEFANKRYYSESNPHDTTMNDFKSGVQWLLGYMAGNDR